MGGKGENKPFTEEKKECRLKKGEEGGKRGYLSKLPGTTRFTGKKSELNHFPNALGGPSDAGQLRMTRRGVGWAGGGKRQ